MQQNTDNEALHWYVGCVMSCREKQAAGALAARGTELYLPLKRELRRWSDRRKLIETPVLPRFIFVRCRNSERAAILAAVPAIWRFLPELGKPAVVRDTEMEAFRRMVEEGPGSVSMAMQPPAPGDRVRVVSGPLAGMECELVSVDGGRCLAVRLGALGTATMDIDLETVEKIK